MIITLTKILSDATRCSHRCLCMYAGHICVWLVRIPVRNHHYLSTFFHFIFCCDNILKKWRGSEYHVISSRHQVCHQVCQASLSLIGCSNKSGWILTNYRRVYSMKQQFNRFFPFPIWAWLLWVCLWDYCNYRNVQFSQVWAHVFNLKWHDMIISKLVYE